ncbi:hypothetical protein ACCO45_004520 [Purpureocillium lilacinum]|uniref:Uncharacterized protein n=1 Tax=Purpureocillium lilacinum TaxID=33203 RepID=A0ACC4E3Y1_PURLI
MEGLGIAANVIALVELSAKVTSLCLDYSKAVKNAKNDIARLRREVIALQHAATNVDKLLIGPCGERLKTSQRMRFTVRDSQSHLEAVYERLRPKTAREALTRFGLRALKWPFECKEFEAIVQSLERCTQAVNLALQVDQTYSTLCHTYQCEVNEMLRNLLFELDRKIVLARLESEVATGASFDSRAEEHNPTCLPDTRVELLQQVSEWALNPGAEAIFWLNGMAGTGKSTISRTAAHNFAHTGRLGASFFFRRGETDRGNIAKFVPTIAADLTRRIPAAAPHIKEAIDDDPGILRRTVRELFEKLIWLPLSILSQSSPDLGPIVIIVDALDECERDDDIRALIQLFSRARTLHSGYLRVFVTSRPELAIRLQFKSIEGKFQGLILHDILEPVVEHDINAFLKHELARIRDEYNVLAAEERQLAKDWPGRANTETLVKMAVPLFIVAATVCRFVADRKIGTPDKQLKKVLVSQGTGQVLQLGATYLSVLNSMIAGVLAGQQQEVVQEFRTIVGAIVVLGRPLSTPGLARILDIPRDDVEGRLDMLHSVLSIPSSPENPVRLLHLSFRDFLLDPKQQAGHQFCIDEKQAHQAMAANCLRVMGCLRQDICDIKAPGTPRSVIDQRKIEACLPQEEYLRFFANKYTAS